MSWFHSILTFLFGASVGIFLALNFSFLIIEQHQYIVRLYYALPGAGVGLLALIWNVRNQERISALSESNEQKEYALSSFDKYAGEPVRVAINEIECLLKRIEKVFHEHARAKKTLKAELEKILEKEALVHINIAYRLCREADAYMREQNIETNFEKHMYYIDEEQKLDDLIISNLYDASKDSQLSVVLGKKLSSIEKALTNKKASIRFKLVEASRNIAASYDAK